MSLEYRDQLKIVVIEKALIGFLILFAGYIFTQSTERFKSDLTRERDSTQAAIKHHQDRLNELLYPLYFLAKEDDMAFPLMYVKDSNPPQKTPFGLILEEQTIIPNHDKVADILSKKSSLLGEAPKLQKTIEQYNFHYSVLKTLRKKGDPKDPNEFNATAAYPKSFSEDIHEEIENSTRAISILLGSKS